MNIEKLKEFKEEHPAECAFIELLNALGAYDKNDINGR